MGCLPSKSPRPKPDDLSASGLALSELQRWKSSIEVLENYRRSREDAGATAQPDDVGDGADQPYGMLRKMLSRKRVANVKESTPASGSTSPCITTQVAQSAPSEATSTDTTSQSDVNAMRRIQELHTISSGELLQTPDPQDIRRKLLNPPHEKQRQATVDALHVVQTAQEDPHFDSMTALAAKIFKVPTAAICIYDRQRLWIKSLHSLKQKVTEVPRESSFCSYMLLSPKQEVMVVEDTHEDGRFHDITNSHANVDRVRFFAAAPLLAANGFQIGAMVITDVKPRKLDAGSFGLLTNLAEMVMRSLEKEAFTAVSSDTLPPPLTGAESLDLDQLEPPVARKGDSSLNVQLISNLANNKLTRVPSEHKSPAEKLSLLRSTNMLDTGIMVCSSDKHGGRVLFVNDIWTQITGVPFATAVMRGLWELFSVTGQDSGAVNKQLQEAFSQQSSMELTARLHDPCGGTFLLSFKTSASSDGLDADMPAVGIPSFVEFSAKRGLCYFFVTVRRMSEEQAKNAVRGDPEGEATAEAPAILEEAGTRNVACQPDSPIQRKSSIPLPYNDDLFHEVKLGPLLGRGSFGRVHRGRWSHQNVAVKIVETFRQGDVGSEVEDMPEAALMEQIQHPNVMATYKHATRVKEVPQKQGHGALMDCAEGGAGGCLLETWLLLEYCNKGSLQDATDRGWFRTEPSLAKGKPDMSIILPTALEMAQALAYLHAQGVLHGDLSPGNVLLCDKPDAPHGFMTKIADFGLSRPTSNSKTIQTQTFGTVTHMPPELLMDGKLTKAGDVYAFGVLLWGMYTGVPPWQGMRRTQVMFKVTALGAKLQIPSSAPPFFKSLLERCMARDHKARPTFKELVAELSVLSELALAGVPLDSPALAEATPVLTAAASFRQNKSLSSSTMQQVMESLPLAEAALKADPAKLIIKSPSLQRRPSFSSTRVQLEVV